MKLNLKNTLLSVIVLASLVGCGSDGGSGNGSTYGNYAAGSASEYVDTARGLPNSLSTADELSQAIVNNNFANRSIGDSEYPIYTISSFDNLSGSNNSGNCDDFEVFGMSLGTICTSSSSSSSSGYTVGGYRGLYRDGRIARSNESLDGAFGSTISQLATFLANKVQESDANGTLFKRYGYGYAPYKDGMCNDYNWVRSYYNGSIQFCTQVAQTYAVEWIVTINGKRALINMNAPLALQPVLRATSVGVSAH
ncbi:hypothetical protein ABMA70_07515 [Halobacteriovorax sp. XZX-3]|uniref:hypothetical protein n=1 Tax=unclassified Halobacteriovorax TaxID=2639665 RepID=UPI000CD1CA01|nr:hypothetical protein [Halobacteriovorax sp. DA5]POB12828.1 hypothetical protein C0Z22_13185 [Halobacteriovorax sp. DA5]